MLRQRLRAWGADESGSAAVEMAIITPLLLVLLLGASDFAKVYRTKMLLVGATKAGAQYGARSKLMASDTAGMEAAARLDANDVDGLDITAQYSCACGGATAACSDVCAGGVAPELFVEVTASTTFETAFRYPGIPHAIPLTQTTKMRVD